MTSRSLRWHCRLQIDVTSPGWSSTRILIALVVLVMLQLLLSVAFCAGETEPSHGDTDKPRKEVRGCGGVLLGNAPTRAPLKVLANGERQYLYDRNAVPKSSFKPGIPYYVFEDEPNYYLVNRALDIDSARREGMYARKTDCHLWETRHAIWRKAGAALAHALPKRNGDDGLPSKPNTTHPIPWPVLREESASSSLLALAHMSWNGLTLETVRIPEEGQADFEHYMAVSASELDRSLRNALGLLVMLESHKLTTAKGLNEILRRYLQSETLWDASSLRKLLSKSQSIEKSQPSANPFTKLRDEVAASTDGVSSHIRRVMSIASNRQFFHKSLELYVFPFSAWQLPDATESRHESDHEQRVVGKDLADLARQATIGFLGGEEAEEEVSDRGEKRERALALKGEEPKEVKCMVDANGLPRQVIVVKSVAGLVDKPRPDSNRISHASSFDVLYVYAVQGDFFRVGGDPFSDNHTAWLARADCLEIKENLWLILDERDQVGPVERMYLWESEEAAREGEPTKAILEERTADRSRFGLLLPVIETSRDGQFYRVALPTSVALPSDPEIRPSTSQRPEAKLTWCVARRQLEAARATFQLTSLDEPLNGRTRILAWVHPNPRLKVYHRVTRDRILSHVESMREALASNDGNITENAQTATLKFLGLGPEKAPVREERPLPPLTGPVKEQMESEQKLKEHMRWRLKRLARYCENPSFACDKYLWVPVSLLP